MNVEYSANRFKWCEELFRFTETTRNMVPISFRVHEVDMVWNANRNRSISEQVFVALILLPFMFPPQNGSKKITRPLLIIAVN